MSLKYRAAMIVVAIMFLPFVLVILGLCALCVVITQVLGGER